MTFDSTTGGWKSDPTKAGVYRITTWWQTMAAFSNWTKSDDFRLAHANKAPEGMFTGPSSIEIHELCLSTDVSPSGEVKRVPGTSYVLSQL